MGWFIAAAVVIFFLLTVPWLGADSRDGRDWAPLAPRPRHQNIAPQGAGTSPAALALRRLARRAHSARSRRPTAEGGELSRRHL